MDEIFTLLTSEDKGKIRNAVIRLIIDRMKGDLEEWGKYILYPPNFQDIVDEAAEDATKEFAEFIKNDMLKNLKNDYITQRK